jgi:CheY-like chemotaxis protein
MTKRILIIEDNPDIALALNEVLSDSGYLIEVAGNGKDGLDHLINRELPDLILLDLFMPVMNGQEFRMRQMKIPYLSNIPIIVMSADACVQNRCKLMHVNHFLKKPFELCDLLEMIKLLDLRVLRSTEICVKF